MAISPGRLHLALEATALDNILTLLWLLICVLAIVVLAYLFTKYVAGKGGGFGISGSGTEQFKVLSRLPLGREQFLALVQAGNRYFLLGVASTGVSPVAELSQEEAQALCQPPGGQSAPPSFGASLRAVLKQKKPR